MNEKKTRFKVARWIFLSLSILTNAFLILYFTLPYQITESWNNFFRNIFVSVVNTATEKEVIPVPITELNVFLSNEETYKYNYLPGYQLNEIPLGSAKQIECTYLPLNTTDKSVEYRIDDNSIATINASGLTASIIGIKAGFTTIHAKNKLSGLESSVDIKVVEIVAPTSLEISLDSNDIPLGSQQTINVNIDGENVDDPNNTDGGIHNNFLKNYCDINRFSNVKHFVEQTELKNNHVILTWNPYNVNVITDYTYFNLFEETIRTGFPEYTYFDTQMDNIYPGNYFLYRDFTHLSPLGGAERVKRWCDQFYLPE